MLPEKTVRSVTNLVKGPKLILAIAAGLLGALAVADAMQLARPSGLAAAACTMELVRGKPDADALVARYESTIREQAKEKDLPPELLAAVIANHQAYMTTFRRFTSGIA